MTDDWQAKHQRLRGEIREILGTPDAMTSLPKRGDRVRVTEFRDDGGRPYSGGESVELESDAEDAGGGYVSFRYYTMKGTPSRVAAAKVEILERAKTQPRIRCAGHYGEMYPRDDSCGWEGQPVELRNGCCPVCGAGHLRQRSNDDTRTQSSGDSTSDQRGETHRSGLRGGATSGAAGGTGPERAEANGGLTPEQCQALATEEQAEFARGMRRAVEIAEDLGFGAYGNRSIAYVDELKEAVEKELEVVTTPAPPLTVAELDSMSNMRANLWPFGWVNRVIAQARRALTLESELARLRLEKAEREELYRRRDEWLRAQEPGKGILDHQVTKDGAHWVKLDVFDGEVRTGPTYESALKAALDKLETP